MKFWVECAALGLIAVLLYAARFLLGSRVVTSWLVGL